MRADPELFPVEAMVAQGGRCLIHRDRDSEDTMCQASCPVGVPRIRWPLFGFASRNAEQCSAMRADPELFPVEAMVAQGGRCLIHRDRDSEDTMCQASCPVGVP